MPLEGLAVPADEPERRAVAAPLVVVQGAPVQVSAHVDAVVDARAHGLERAASCSRCGGCRRRSRCRSRSRRPAPRPCPRVADALADRGGVVLPAGERALGVRRRSAAGRPAPMRVRVYACTPTQSSPSAASRKTSSRDAPYSAATSSAPGDRLVRLGGHRPSGALARTAHDLDRAPVRVDECRGDRRHARAGGRSTGSRPRDRRAPTPCSAR